METVETVVLDQGLPSYLKEFFPEDIKCRIVYSQNPMSIISTKEENDSIEVNIPVEKKPVQDEASIGEENVLDYIERECKQQEEEISDGMLQIDLEDKSIEKVAESPKPKPEAKPQPTTEEYHYPLTEPIARDILSNHCATDDSHIPTFCVINDKHIKGHKEQTQVILGGYKTEDYTTSISVHTYVVFPLESDFLKWDMFKKGIRNKRRTTEEYTFRRIYDVYGSEIKDAAEIGENMAAITLETCWNKPVETETSIVGFVMKMKIQMVYGHKKSSLYHLWSELKHLDTFMRVLDDEDSLQIDGTIISDDDLPSSKIAENIHNLCTNPITREPKSSKLTLHNLRELTILDRLWSILIHCKDLIDLKNSLSVFFRIVKEENLMDGDRAVQLVKDLNIKDYVANLTLQESLKFLVAIGCEKLKNDYLAIVSFHNTMHQTELEKIWSKYCQVKPPVLTRKSMAPNQVKYFELTDTTFNKQKMSLLCKLHIISEHVIFLMNNLGESVKLSDENFRKICNEVFQKYIFTNENVKASEQLAPELISNTFVLDSKNEELYKRKTPVKKIYECKSTFVNSENNKDASIFAVLVSKTPIFPKCIFDDPALQKVDPEKKSPVSENNYSVAIFRSSTCGSS